MKIIKSSIIFLLGLVLGIIIVGTVVSISTIQVPEPIEETIQNSTEESIGLIKNDNDLDGLNNSFEKKIGTDPNKKDTDADGYNDSYEYEQNKLNPMKKDIVIEVDYQKGTEKKSFERLRNKFRNAPVKNPDGSKGINLHIIKDDMSLNITRWKYSKHINKSNKYYDYEKKGYHHVIVVKQPIMFDGKQGGYHDTNIDSFVIKDTTQNYYMMHELGHALGLSVSDYDGIDGLSKSLEKYDSVMNYNSILDRKLRYSSNGEFNDWKHINNSMINKNPIND